MAELKTSPGRKCSLGLDFGTASVRAIVVDCKTGEELAQAVSPYAHGVVSEALPEGAAGSVARRLPADFALQHPRDYLESAEQVIRSVLERVSPEWVIGIGVDFTACTMLPVRADGTPLVFEERFGSEPHAWVKLWKHHGAFEEAERVTALARERDEAFLKYTGGEVSSEWMLPKCWETARRAPDVYREAAYFVDAGDWVVQQMTGIWSRSTCSAGYKGHWSSEEGFPSVGFLKALDPVLESLPSKWIQEMAPPGRPVGSGVSEAFARRTGLIAGTAVSAATIDAHAGVPGMGVYREGPMSIIMGTSSCHMVLSRDLRFFEGYAGAVRDGILEGFYGYESGQCAVGDIFGWFSKRFAGLSFEELSTRAAALEAGQSGLVALDWMNGNRSVLMDPQLSGAIVGLTLETRPEEVYRALIEATAFGTRRIVEAYRRAGIPLSELVVCGGLVQDPLILQIYADATALPVRVAESTQAVALGAAIFGALAAGSGAGGYDSVEGAVTRMTRPASRVVEPRADSRSIYDRLYAHYVTLHDLFGRGEHVRVMKDLKKLRTEGRP